MKPSAKTTTLFIFSTIRDVALLAVLVSVFFLLTACATTAGGNPSSETCDARAHQRISEKLALGFIPSEAGVQLLDNGVAIVIALVHPTSGLLYIDMQVDSEDAWKISHQGILKRVGTCTRGPTTWVEGSALIHNLSGETAELSIVK